MKFRKNPITQEQWRREWLDQNWTNKSDEEINRIYGSAIERMINARWRLREAYAENNKREIDRWQKDVDYQTAVHAKALEELRRRKLPEFGG